MAEMQRFDDLGLDDLVLSDVQGEGGEKRDAEAPAAPFAKRQKSTGARAGVGRRGSTGGRAGGGGRGRGFRAAFGAAALAAAADDGVEESDLVAAAPALAAATEQKAEVEEEVVDPCNVCRLSTASTRRYCTGKNCPTFLHHACSNAQKALGYQVDKRDREKALKNGVKNDFQHKKNLGDVRRTKPLEYRKMVMLLVLEDGARRTMEDRHVAAKWVETLTTFLKCYVAEGVSMLPYRACSHEIR